MFRVCMLAAAALTAGIAQADTLTGVGSRGSEGFGGVNAVIAPEVASPSVDLTVRSDNEFPYTPGTALPSNFHNGLSFNDPEYVDPHRQRVQGDSMLTIELYDPDAR